jgi:hypothetical protein
MNWPFQEVPRERWGVTVNGHGAPVLLVDGDGLTPRKAAALNLILCEATQAEQAALRLRYTGLRLWWSV